MAELNQRFPVMLRTKDLADLCGMSPNTVKWLAMQGRIPFVRTPGGHRRYPAQAVEQLTMEREMASNRRTQAHQRRLCTQNKCGNAPELANLFGHGRIAHTMTNSLVGAEITTVTQLRKMSDSNLSSIRGIGVKTLNTIRTRASYQGA